MWWHAELPRDILRMTDRAGCRSRGVEGPGLRHPAPPPRGDRRTDFPRNGVTMAKQLEVRVPHSLGQDEVKRRLDEALVRARTEYADAVGEISAEWIGDDTMRFDLAVAGMKFDGSLEILLEELLVKLDLPGAALLFKGRIREGIQERLGGLVG